MKHGLRCLVRLVRILLGPSAIADKIDCGMKLVVLGVEFDLDDDGFQCRPSDDKVGKWIKRYASVYSNGWGLRALCLCVRVQDRENARRATARPR